MSVKLTDTEVLDALGDESLRAHAITRRVEQHWAQAGHQCFLGYGTVYRHLDGMVHRGLLLRRGLAYCRTGEVSA